MRFAMRRAVLAASLVLMPSLALAHPGLPGHTHDLASGLMHPIGGLDHVLAMVAAAMALVGFFAIFHGYAHGIETPETASGLLYGLGFVAATALLHGLGVGIGL